MIKLDPQAKVYLDNFYKMPTIHSMEPKIVRELMAQAPPPKGELVPLSKIEDRHILVDKNEEIKLRIYTPEGEGPFPLFIYYHGGGWVLGDVEGGIDSTCRMIANKTGRVLISVNYRLAPEYKFPIPLEDSYTALLWAHENAPHLNGDPSNIVVGGDSAGGNLATGVSMMTRNRKGPILTAEILIYPVTQLDYNTKSYEQFATGFGLDRDLMKWFGKHYINTEEDKRNEYVAPLLATDLSSHPPTLIITAENDVLRDEGLLYAEALKRAGVQVEYKCELGMVHGFFSNLPYFQNRVRNTICEISDFLILHTNKE